MEGQALVQGAIGAPYGVLKLGISAWAPDRAYRARARVRPGLKVRVGPRLVVRWRFLRLEAEFLGELWKIR